MREVLEETGLDVAVHRVTGVYKNMSRAVVAVVLLCSPIGGSLRTSSETDEATWMAPDKAVSMMPAVFGIRISDALSQTGQAYQRSHDGKALLP